MLCAEYQTSGKASGQGFGPVLQTANIFIELYVRRTGTEGLIENIWVRHNKSLFKSFAIPLDKKRKRKGKKIMTDLQLSVFALWQSFPQCSSIWKALRKGGGTIE